MSVRITLATVGARVGWTSRTVAQRLERWRGEGVAIPGVHMEGRRAYYTEEFYTWFLQHINKRPVIDVPEPQPDATPTETPAPTGESWQVNGSGDTQTITSVSNRIRSLEDALAHASIDTTIWEVERFVVNSWEMGYKTDDGAATLPLWQVKVWLKRRVAVYVEQAISALTERMAAHAPDYAPADYQPVADPHLLEITLVDQHFGKLAWRRETGEDYDLHIAEQLYRRAIDDLLAKSAGFPIERILLPIGNDFLHIDNLAVTTANGTIQDADGRFAKIVEVGQMALVHAIDRLRHVAPVDILLVPGNHDNTTIWHTARFLHAWYRKDKAVNCDHEPIARKYHRYGCNLVGFTHGDEEKHLSLPAIMATERPHDWAETRFREWHLGHLHKRRETHHVAVDSHDGVIVRILPSLTGRDRWHYNKGYIGNRLADAYLWSRDNGPSGYFTTSA